MIDALHGGLVACCFVSLGMGNQKLAIGCLAAACAITHLKLMASMQP